MKNPSLRIFLALPLLFAGCSSFRTGGESIGDPSFVGGGPGGPDVIGPSPGGGVDTGGAQDIAFARSEIQAGRVPQGNTITVEGLLSEHDIPENGAACTSLTCLRPAVATALSLETGQLERWVHLGMVTGLDLATWKRPPIDLVIAIDKSSSMSIDLAETTTAAAHLIGQLRADDRVSVIAFDEDVHVLKELGAVDDANALETAVKGLTAAGGANIDAAMDAGFARLTTADPQRLRRLVVLSCEYPLVSSDGNDPASVKIVAHGKEGIGFTMVGVLLSYSGELAQLLGGTNGANYYYLSDTTHVAQVFDTDADLALTPLAYDLSLQLGLSDGWTLDRMYGIPDDNGAPADHYTVATVFPSHRRGSIVARLHYTGSGEPSASVGNVGLSYRPEPAIGFSGDEAQSVAVTLGTPAADGTYFESNGVRKAAALVNEATQLTAACDAYWNGDHDGAIAKATALRDYLTSENTALMDPALDPEVALVGALLANLSGTPAPQSQGQP